MDIVYNTTLETIAIREYGRNVQRMVDHLFDIEDKVERTAAAHDVIKVMNQVNPDTTKSTDYDHKLWDHLHIMGRYQLDVNSPYDKPQPEALLKRPDIPAYTNGRIEFRHYGKVVEKMIETACQEEDIETRQKMSEYIAGYMKLAYKSWNEEKVADDVIIQNLKDLSGGKLSVQKVYEISDGTVQSRLKPQAQNNRNKKKKGSPNKRRPNSNNTNPNSNNNRRYKR